MEHEWSPAGSPAGLIETFAFNGVLPVEGPTLSHEQPGAIETGIPEDGFELAMVRFCAAGVGPLSWYSNRRTAGFAERLPGGVTVTLIPIVAVAPEFPDAVTVHV
jgi:hypothetical protein